MKRYVVLFEYEFYSVTKIFEIRSIAINVASIELEVASSKKSFQPSIKVYYSEVEFIEGNFIIGGELSPNDLIYDVNLNELAKNSFNNVVLKKFTEGYSILKSNNFYRLYFNFNFIGNFNNLTAIEKFLEAEIETKIVVEG